MSHGAESAIHAPIVESYLTNPSAGINDIPFGCLGKHVLLESAAMSLPPVTPKEETPPQCLGEFRPVDQWQAHLNTLFYGLQGDRLRDYSQTMASGDYRLAHALAENFYMDHRTRQDLPAMIVVHEWGAGNGNLAACFLSHLKILDTAGDLYSRVQYCLIDNKLDLLRVALTHPDLQAHRAQVCAMQADVQDLSGFKDNSVHWIVSNELWSDLPTKVMLRKEGEVLEEQMRPNLSAEKTKQYQDWFGLVKDFGTMDLDRLRNQRPFLEDIIWEKDYQPVEWKRVPYRKTIADFLKPIEELVLVPVNLGAFATMTEAKRLLQRGGRFISFDAGTPDLEIIGDPDKPCYSLRGGQYTFIVNFALCKTVAERLNLEAVSVEPQKEFVARQLGKNVLTLPELLNTYPFPGKLKAWERDRLILRTLEALSSVYSSPYRRAIDFPIRPDVPETERADMIRMMHDLSSHAIPDNTAYLTEDEVLATLPALESLGFSKVGIQELLGGSSAVPPCIDYYLFSFVA